MCDLFEKIQPAEWQDFVVRCQGCSACALARTRNQVVIYRGAVPAPLLFLGEAPGANEDLAGRPFVGRSGRLLEQLLRELGFGVTDYHVANIVKCRPPANRVPTPAEITACTPWLEEQIRLLGTKYVVTLGATAYRWMTGAKKATITALRGSWQKNEKWPAIELMPTLHPSYILRCHSQLPLLRADLALVRQRVSTMKQEAKWRAGTPNGVPSGNSDGERSGN